MSRLQAMELLVATVREGSFSAAGRRAGLSPASVSRHIGELEATLGVQLFNRTTRHLSLTEAGKIYAQRAEQILHSIEDAGAAALALQKHAARHAQGAFAHAVRHDGADAADAANSRSSILS